MLQIAVTGLILETFRLNGHLLAAGDAHVADAGLTSVHWRVMRAIALFPAELPVAHIARNMRLTRQAVQQLASKMEREGLVRLAPNPHHQLAKLVLLAAHGQVACHAAMKRQVQWVRRLTRGLNMKEIETATAMLRTTRRGLDDQSERENNDA